MRAQMKYGIRQELKSRKKEALLFGRIVGGKPPSPPTAGVSGSTSSHRPPVGPDEWQLRKVIWELGAKHKKRKKTFSGKRVC